MCTDKYAKACQEEVINAEEKFVQKRITKTQMEFRIELHQLFEDQARRLKGDDDV